MFRGCGRIGDGARKEKGFLFAVRGCSGVDRAVTIGIGWTILSDFICDLLRQLRRPFTDDRDEIDLCQKERKDRYENRSSNDCSQPDCQAAQKAEAHHARQRVLDAEIPMTVELADLVSKTANFFCKRYLAIFLCG